MDPTTPSSLLLSGQEWQVQAPPCPPRMCVMVLALFPTHLPCKVEQKEVTIIGMTKSLVAGDFTLLLFHPPKTLAPLRTFHLLLLSNIASSPKRKIPPFFINREFVLLKEGEYRLAPAEQIAGEEKRDKKDKSGCQKGTIAEFSLSKTRHKASCKSQQSEKGKPISDQRPFFFSHPSSPSPSPSLFLFSKRYHREEATRVFVGLVHPSSSDHKVLRNAQEK
ncbi:hypothetical protein HOY80DRAFT_709550 [Tuber brumale]|nr:hypothetical protein HOY80DRAFT_709550 [Tuber brumale]